MNIERLTNYIKKQNHKLIFSIGEFSLLKPIGQGGNGLVFEAEIQEKKVAIKFLITDSTGKTKDQKEKRFLAEYFNIATIDDLSSIVRYIDYDLLKITDDQGELEVPIIIMKKYDFSLIKLEGKPNQDLFLLLFKFLLDTTNKIHRYGIIHRDIKPENILIENKNFILADFGIASYNPEIFQIRASTDNKERLGNRLFSAPEQEEKGVKPHPTMDIYAIGQVLQWYATGKTHRGTGRQNISTIFKDCQVHDRIIERCLENNPTKRFQSIEEIREFIVSSREKDAWQYLRAFNRICRGNFPKNEYGTVHSSDIKRIDRMFNSLKEKEEQFENHLWWHDGSGNLDFTLIQKGEGKWVLLETEYNIKEIWVNYSNDLFNDYILVHFIPSKPFIINEKETYYTTIVDDKYHISYSESQNGFAEIEGDIKDLSKHKVESIERNREEGYFFISTRYHCILRSKNDKTVRDFISKLMSNEIPDITEFRKFNQEIRIHKHDKIIMSL